MAAAKPGKIVQVRRRTSALGMPAGGSADEVAKLVPHRLAEPFRGCRTPSLEHVTLEQPARYPTCRWADETLELGVAGHKGRELIEAHLCSASLRSIDVVVTRSRCASRWDVSPTARTIAQASPPRHVETAIALAWAGRIEARRGSGPATSPPLRPGVEPLDNQVSPLSRSRPASGRDGGA